MFYLTHYTVITGALIPFNPKRPWCSIALSLGGVALVRPYHQHYYLLCGSHCIRAVSQPSTSGNVDEGCFCIDITRQGGGGEPALFRLPTPSCPS